MTYKIGLGLPTSSYILKNTDRMRTEEKWYSCGIGFNEMLLTILHSDTLSIGNFSVGLIMHENAEFWAQPKRLCLQYSWKHHSKH